MLLPLDRLQVFEVKACNGLICYKNVDNPAHLCLWNPAIRKLKIITKSPHSSIHRGPDSFVLWFDTKSNDYKISTICCIRDISTRNAVIVELYSLSTNSWKVVSENAPCAPRRLVCVNGILLWHENTIGDSVIISLDAENGIFKKKVEAGSSIPISFQSFGDEYFCVFGYGVGKKCICCRFVQVYDEKLNKLCEFDFKDYKVDLSPVGFRNNGKLLFCNMDDICSIVSFNLETAEIKDYAQGWSCCSLHWVTPFVETLALLNDKTAMYEPNLSLDTQGKIDEEP